MPVEFDEQPILPTRPMSAKPKKTSFVTGLVLKTGLVKTEKGANLVLGVVFVIAAALTLYMNMGGSVTVEPPSEDEYLIQ